MFAQTFAPLNIIAILFFTLRKFFMRLKELLYTDQRGSQTRKAQRCWPAHLHLPARCRPRWRRPGCPLPCASLSSSDTLSRPPLSQQARPSVPVEILLKQASMSKYNYFENIYPKLCIRWHLEVSNWFVLRILVYVITYILEALFD